MSAERLMILVIFVIVSGINCTRTQEKIHGEGICQFPENCTLPQVPPPSTEQPYGIPPPKPQPTVYPPYSTAATPPPPPPAPAYPAVSPPPPTPPAVEGQYSSPSDSIPPPNPYTYLNDTMDSADAPLSALPLFGSTTVFHILFLFAYYA
ncbi:hypothetical protein DCAR_0418208 [Daucus carota subsp. sativus]|uniref:Extensin domain-containing protein n=1 Tax=Daucus carota subsp. sativus TaxID=79200 RepID=A0A165Z8H7_DAUCS|nr:PREDICTED: leucine-rich repeat extensin-like protein 3 [Daucus carota subsp. sativus]WOG98862.1 hypothetical protein DCAR_0418208 [Daucus carota subsp. sativus]